MKQHALSKVVEAQSPGVYVSFELKTLDDDNQMRPDTIDEGFWPSRNPENPGYIGEHPKVDYETQLANANERMRAWREDEWRYIGVQAIAHIYDKHHGSVTTYSIKSSGIWGIESDQEDYIQEVFQDQCNELKDLLERMSSVRYIR